MLAVLQISVEQGFIFALLAIGVVLTYKLLDIADLSVEGTFPLGAFVLAKILTVGMPPELGLLIAFCAGALAGGVTYLLYKRVRIAALLSGILTMTMLHTVNLRILGKSNVPLMNLPNLFRHTDGHYKIFYLIGIALVVKILLDWFLRTEKGYLVVVTGDNETLVRSLGENPNTYTLLGLMLSNGLVALSGALMAQFQGYVDISMGQSMIVTALASIIIGDAFMKNQTWLNRTTRAIVGAIIYRVIFGIALHIGLSPDDLKMMTALIVILFLGYNHLVANAGMRRRIVSSQKGSAHRA